MIRDIEIFRMEGKGGISVKLFNIVHQNMAQTKIMFPILKVDL